MANLDNCVFENNGIFFTGEEDPGDNINQLTPQVYNGVTLPQGVYRRKISSQPGFQLNTGLLSIDGYGPTSQLGMLPDGDALDSGVPFWVNDNFSSQTDGIPSESMGNGYIAKVWMKDTQPGLPSNEVEVTIELIGDFVMPENPLVVSLDIDGDAEVYEVPFYTQEVAQDADTPFKVSFFPVFNSQTASLSGTRVAPRADLQNQVQTWGFNGAMEPPDTLDGTSMLVTGVPIAGDGSIGGHADEVRYPTLENYAFFHKAASPVAPSAGSYMFFGTPPGAASMSGQSGMYGLLSGLGCVQQPGCITLENYNSESGFTYNMFNTSIELSSLPESLTWIFRMSYGTSGYDPATGTGGNPAAFVPSACSIYQVSAGLRSVSGSFSSGSSSWWAIGGGGMNLINSLNSPLNTLEATFEAHPDDNNKTMILTIPLQQLFAFNQTSLEASFQGTNESFVLEAGGAIAYGVWIDIVTASIDIQTGEILYEG